MTITYLELVEDVADLVSFPEVCLRVNEKVNDPDSSAMEVAELISQDPALTAKVLRIANSPLYGYATKIDTVTRAVTVLGMSQIRDMVIATSATQVFDGLPNSLVSMDDFWQHSIYCGLAARALAAHMQRIQGESLFVAGLLHDIGQLVIMSRIPDLARQAMERAMNSDDEQSLYLYEREVMGFDHTDVGGALLRLWKLPELLYECVRYHHEPGLAQQHAADVAIIHIANTLAILAELDTTEMDQAPPIDPRAWELTGLDETVIKSVVAQCRQEFGEMRSILLG